MARDDFRRRGTPLLDDEEPFHAPMILDDDEAPIGGALRYVLRDPRLSQYDAAPPLPGVHTDDDAPIDAGVVGPPDLRSQEEIDRAALYAENRRRLATRPQSRTRAIHMGQRLREEHGGFAPGVAAMQALQIPLMGNADEILGAIEAGIDPAMDYEDAQQALEENLAIGAQESPWSSRAGMAAGMGLAAPLAEFTAPTAAAGASVPMTLARGALRPALAGAAMGGTAGYLRAPEGRELESTLEGAATGGLIGATGGAGIAGARALRAAYPGIVGTTAAGALEGASYGELATPGTSSGTILDQERLLDDMPLGVATGAFMGGGMAAGGRVLSSVPRGVATLQEGIAGRRTPVRAVADVQPVDEALLDVAGMVDDGADDLAVGASALGPSADEIAEQTFQAAAREPWFTQFVRESLATDPVYARFRSVGLSDRHQIRQIIRSFGGPDRALAALRRAGLARPGIYSQGSQVAAAEAITPAMTRDLARIHRSVTERGRLIPGDEIAEGIDALTPAYSRPTSTLRERNIRDSLRARADEYRYGSEGERPVTTMEELRPVAELTPMDDGPSVFVDELDAAPVTAPITAFPDEIAIDYPELRHGMASQALQNQRAYGGRQTTPLTPEQEAGLDVYRAQQAVRDREIRETLGEAGYQDYLRRNSAFRAASAVAPPSDRLNLYAARNPAALLGQLSGMGAQATGGPFGRIYGELQQRLIGQYRDSIMATLNEIGTHPAETMATMPRVVRLLEWAATPGPDIQIGSLRIPRNAQAIANAIEMAAREGTGPATIAALEAARDERRMPEIEARRAATPEAQQSEQQAIEEYASRRRAAMHERLSPREAAATVEADPNVDQDFVRERRARMHERLRRRAEGSTP